MASPRAKLPLIRWPAAVLLLALAAATAGLSLNALIEFAAAADLFDLASSIEQGSSPDAAYLAQFVADHRLDRPTSDCGDAVTRANLTVDLAALDAATKEVRLTLADTALKNALGAANRRLRCNALDGNAWLRKAMLEARAGGVTPAVVAALKLSYWTAPSEAWILATRLDFASNLYVAGVSGFESEYEADLSRFVSYAPTDRVGKAYVDAAPAVRAKLHGLIAIEPSKRNRAITTEIDRLGVDFTREPAP